MSQLTTNQILSALITYNREIAGYTIAKLAFDLDISYQHLWDLENNHRTITETRLEAIITTLQTTPEAFWQNMSLAIAQHKQKIPATNA